MWTNYCSFDCSFWLAMIFIVDQQSRESTRRNYPLAVGDKANLCAHREISLNCLGNHHEERVMRYMWDNIPISDYGVVVCQ